MTYLTEVKEKKDDDQLAQSDEGDDVIFDQAPVRVVCSQCGLNIITFIEHESSWVTYAVCVGLFLVLGWAALCVVPIVYPLFKDVVHHCPRCLSVLATRSRVVLPGIKQEIMSFRFGSCVVVLARKYVLMLVALTALIGGIHFVRTSGHSVTGIDAVEKGPIVQLSWQDFVNDCGFKTYLGNPIHVTMAFNKKYKNQTLRWEGAVHHVEEGLSFLGFNSRGTLFLRMNPPQFPAKRELADVALLYSEGTDTATKIGKLRRGTNITFDATMVAVGRRGDPHAMLLWEVLETRKLQPVLVSTDSLAGAVVP